MDEMIAPATKRVTKVLIANRGEIAVRIAATCKAMGIATVAVVSEADRTSLHARACDEVVVVGPAAARESYLRTDRILEAATATGADAIHPGYGFLSENTDFARAVMAAGLVWIGPPPDAIDAMGSKIAARLTMEAAGVPVVPGIHSAGQAIDALVAAGNSIGYPLLVKAAAGGGGKGMRSVHDPKDLVEAIEGAQREALAAFGDGAVYLEKLLLKPRHVEIQVFADAHGTVVHLGERECSIQRRHQKVIEEAPSPFLTPELRAAMGQAAVAAARAVAYVGAGTVEFMVDAEGHFYFLEMNTRLQVEHPVTELITGLDLVAWQIRVARGERLPFADCPPLRGWAMEARLYAEDPTQGFLPATGRLLRFRLPSMPGVRLDTGYVEGDEIMMHYDPMIAKLITWGETREAARERLVAALSAWEIAGVTTNVTFLRDLAAHPAFARGDTHTGFIAEHWPDGYAEAPIPRELLVALAVAGAFGGSSPLASPFIAAATTPSEGAQEGADPVSVWHRVGTTGGRA
jgi:acetyl-CoA carboxylase biotin carboxylase subunit